MPIVWNIPFQRNPYFTGRDEILADLHSAFAAKKKIVLTQPQVISGLGGIGKTQTALEYAYRYSEGYRYIFWTRADTNELLVSDFGNIASLLDLPVKDDKNQDLSVSSVKYWLQTHNDWLLILDNADDLETARNFLPTRLQGHILLTSREPATGADIQGIAVENMTQENGVPFILRRSKLIALDALPNIIAETERNKAREIVELMGGLPLALAQAGAYIERTNCGLSGYIERYQQRRMKLLKERRGLTADHPEPVATTWSLSFEKVEQSLPAAADLLRLCAFLHPDAIPEEMIINGASQLSPALECVVSDVLEFDDAIIALFKYSLIRRNSDSKTLTIHRLVQAVLKDEMDEDTQRQWAERVVQVVNQAFPNVTFPVWQQCQRYLPHAQVCATLIKQWHMTFPSATRLLKNAGRYSQEYGQYTEAEELLTQLLTICEQTLGPEHPDTATCLNNLASLYQAQGKYQEPEPLLAICEQILGPEHPDTATCLNNLALLYQAQGKYQNAEPLLKRALTICEQASGPEHPDTATSLNNLALLYQDQGKYQDAELLLKRSLAIYEQALGPEHPDTASNLNNLALLYQDQSKYQDAEFLCQRALTISEQALGPEHPSTATSLNNLASLYKAQDNYKDAEPLLKRALAICEQALGPKHPSTAGCLSNLASLHQAQGRYIQAEPLLKRSLAIYEQALGPKHPSTATSLSNLASFYLARNNYQKAEPLYQRALAIYERALGSIHPKTALTLENYAIMLRRANRNSRAAEMEARVEAIRKKQQEENIWIGDIGLR